MKYRVWSHLENKFLHIDGLDTDYQYVVYPNGTLVLIYTAGYAVSIHDIDNSDYVIQQSTGKFDINGVEIFEGDIVTYNYYCSGMYDEVRDVTTSVVLSIESNLTPQSGNGYDFQDVIENIKVIGHIFEKKDE